MRQLFCDSLVKPCTSSGSGYSSAVAAGGGHLDEVLLGTPDFSAESEVDCGGFEDTIRATPLDALRRLLADRWLALDDRPLNWW
mmetsp:Transcript_69592/g.185268  ORF Transcript_69592/g.185268 Transcript_69592/m.185268 type:complete len:84 (-) Transcript_69592:751-1002(-)